MIVDVIVWGVFWFLILTLLIFAVILCAPVILGAEFDTAERPAFRITMAVCGGLFPAFSLYEKRGESPGKKTKKPAAEKQEKKRKRSGFVASAPDMVRAAPRFVSETAAQVKIEAMNADISFGFSNPADTGVVYGALSPFMVLFNAAPAVHLALQPDFNEAAFRGRGRLAARFTPIALAPPMLCFGWLAFVSPRLSKAFI